MKYLLLIFISFTLSAQNWHYQALAPMPEARANNAVCNASVAGIDYVYSFAGIDTSKVYTGISGKNFRYNTVFDFWEEIQPLPDGDKWIAMGASTIKNQIYVVGGYEVFSNGAEISCNKVYQFNPLNSSFVDNEIILPLPIDDHVQCVYKDSLLYIVSGWSNNTNVTDVMIYNPSNQSWLSGTPLPNMNEYAVFGGSGTIIGDTLYYIGGAKIGPNFPITQILRKGYINPDNPADITWFAQQNPNALGYRQACTNWNGQAIWIGGSSETYNYNGLSYTSNSPVLATNRLVIYNPQSGNLSANFGFMPKIMDLRGIAKINENEFIICGGMQEGQQVTSTTFRIFYQQDVADSIEEPERKNFAHLSNAILNITNHNIQSISLVNMGGQTVLQSSNPIINLKNLPNGIYVVVGKNFNGQQIVQKIKLIK